LAARELTEVGDRLKRRPTRFESLSRLSITPGSGMRRPASGVLPIRRGRRGGGGRCPRRGQRRGPHPEHDVRRAAARDAPAAPLTIPPDRALAQPGSSLPVDVLAAHCAECLRGTSSLAYSVGPAALAETHRNHTGSAFHGSYVQSEVVKLVLRASSKPHRPLLTSFARSSRG
jgi:hypothetical protein